MTNKLFVFEANHFKFFIYNKEQIDGADFKKMIYIFDLLTNKKANYIINKNQYNDIVLVEQLSSFEEDIRKYEMLYMLEKYKEELFELFSNAYDR